MPAIPITGENTDDIYSYGFGKSLVRPFTNAQLDNTITYNSILDSVNGSQVEFGTNLAGWTIGEDKLYKNNITLDAAIGRITVGNPTTGIIIDAATQKITIGSSNIVLDAANKRMLINDGTNDRVLIGYQSGGF